LLADTVWLKNGDKLSGKIIPFDGGKLLIQTQYAGAVTIDWKRSKPWKAIRNCWSNRTPTTVKRPSR
jgi:hypothetical protein